MKPFENISFNRTEGLNSPDRHSTLTVVGKVSENQLMLRLKEMKRINSFLEKLIEQRTLRLREVIATNTKFLSILAHDLRSPFSSILCTLEIIKENLNNFNKSEIINYIDIASNSANNTLNLLDNLLAWTIAQNNGKSFNPVKINLRELLKDEIDNMNVAANQKQIMLNHSIAPNLNIAADTQMIRTVLRNLLSNAIKYTNTGGEINISALAREQYVEITVKDNGIGISRVAQRNLFKNDGFYSKTGTNNERGTGLGLLICKEFIEIHGGYIGVESIQGKGCKVIFTMPHYI
ncbi:MAG: HAMP domain-containing histidine kinase [Bacteroidales bacterium]|nr:HAMP domain-containing histidine kinase [Bacteroidales bacterium]